ncbi:hypothetical protein PRIC1_009433 [Phytophthora ramorum]|uniref:uncharacterized protein n=1 Tax=Phytophthora ramorum TaxID=164328 RepID=UPI0030ABAAC9|nr:hypothetical protein KRP23_5811 [Phytophthora ramorum]
MASSSAPYAPSSHAPGAPPASHALSASLASNREHFNPLQQRAAAAAQALLAPERKVSQVEIQAMLEKNEAALRTWNALHKQQPSKTNPMEHKEWVRRCLAYRQQIGTRLEVLASLADKQIAQEDEKTGGQRVSPSSAGARLAATPSNSTLSAPTTAALQAPRQQTPAVSQQVYAPPQVSTMDNNLMTMTTSASMGSAPASLASGSAPIAMPNMSAPMPFPEPLMPTVGFTPTSSSMFFPTGQMNPMQASAGFTATSSMAVSSATTSTQGYAMTSGVQAFTPNAYMASTSGAPSSSAAYMNQQNFMMGGGMMNPHQQQFVPMAMPMNLVSSDGGNMYGDNNFGMNSAQTSTSNSNTGNDSSNNITSNFPVDPFITPLGFGPDANFGAPSFPMVGMTGMPAQQQHVMPMNGGNFVAQAPMMMNNNFGYGAGVGMPTGSTTSSQSIMQQPMPTQQYQPVPSGLQPFHQHNQLPQHPPQQTGAGSMSMSPDSALYGDSNVNIFEGLTDDAFFPMQ